jgi:glycosyltransferase involved in cell wall biosynthesis
LTGALTAYRSAFNVLKFAAYPATLARAVTVRARNRLLASVAPRLGNLQQYAPRSMSLPRSYKRAITLSAEPKISIVTPAFRQAAYISRTIDSVLGQNYTNLEYFVQDGGSQDGTVDILNRYGSRLSGWESKSDGGQAQALNLGFARTTGEIMAWLNSDDILLPGAIFAIVDYFNRHEEIDVVYGNRLLIDENDLQIGRWILPGHDDEVLSWADYVPQESLFWRRRIWERVGGRIDESFRFAMDWDLLVRFRNEGARFAHIPRFLGAFRIHDQQKTSATINEIGHQEMDRIRERVHGRVPGHQDISKALRPFLLKHLSIDMIYRIRSRLGKLQ